LIKIRAEIGDGDDEFEPYAGVFVEQQGPQQGSLLRRRAGMYQVS
jgi:hypothetical protein